MMIWERYFLKEFFKIFFLFLIVFYGLYIIIDYSSRSAAHYAGKFTFREMVELYTFIFVQRMDILIPFAMIVSAVKTYTTLNLRNELVALMTAGVKLKRLMRPFLLVGFAGVLLLLINEEILLPVAYHKINYLKDKYSDDHPSQEQERNVQSVEVKSGGRLIFHSYDSIRKSFFDVFWLKSPDEIYKIKYLFPRQEVPFGNFVDHLQRDDEGKLLVVESKETLQFPEMEFDEDALRDSMTDPRQESLTSLLKHFSFNLNKLNDAKARTLTSILHKTAIPWLCFLAIIGPAPFCLRFTKELPVFFIYLVSMLAMVTYYLIMNSALILGENQVLHPFIAIGVPFSLYFSYFMYKYIKL